MFLASYEKLRKNIVSENTIINMVYPGRGIFGSDFGTTAFVLKNKKLNLIKAHIVNCLMRLAKLKRLKYVNISF